MIPEVLKKQRIIHSLLFLFHFYNSVYSLAFQAPHILSFNNYTIKLSKYSLF